jgi:mannitol 2-dehydrogenase
LPFFFVRRKNALLSPADVSPADPCSSTTQCYLNGLLAQDWDTAKRWCYTGVGVMPADVKMRDYLKDNGFAYPIVSRAGAEVDSFDVEVEEVVAMRDMLLAFEDPVRCVKAMADEDVKIVSLTITEFGYRVPLTKGDFSLIEQALNGVLDDPEEPLHAEAATPTTFGVICAAAALRFSNGTRPFTLMSCDNLPHNGEVCKRRMTGAAEELVCAGLCATSLDEFVVWLQREVRYPSTMVDRITPATSMEDVATLPATLGFEDNWPVMCEPYKHWVIEEAFVDDERPPWEDVGAVVVRDVVPHELMKVRLLNVTHSAMCYAGILAGLTHVHEAVTHSKLRAFLRKVQLEEIGPTLQAHDAMAESPILLHGMEEYAEMVLRRFENVAVKDQLERIAMDGSEKFRVQGQDVVCEGIRLGNDMRGFALYVASWACFLRREVEEGNEVRDMGGAAVTACFQEGGTGIACFLGMEEIFGELSKDFGAEWRENVIELFETISQEGMSAALDAVISEVAAPELVAVAR